MNLLCLPKYGRQGASSRLRTWQYIPTLESMGASIHAVPLIGSEALRQKYAVGRFGWQALAGSFIGRVLTLLKRNRFDAIWCEKELFPYLPEPFERLLTTGKPLIVDYDDAIFHNYDLSNRRLVRQVLGRKIDAVMHRARIVMVGNGYLGARAERAGANDVRIIPTSVDILRYPQASTVRSAALSGTIVWIGSPSTSKYLDLISRPLSEIATERPIRLKVIGAKAPSIAGCDTVSVPWAENTEVEEIRAGDIGIMPLADGPWEHGKCAYKLIQYMACALPVIASDVGANRDVVIDGVNGFLVKSEQQWAARIRQLLSKPTLAFELGQAGRRTVTSKFSTSVQGPRIFQALLDTTISPQRSQ